MAQHLRLVGHVAAHAQEVVILCMWAPLVAAVLAHAHADVQQIRSRHRLALGALTLVFGHVISSAQQTCWSVVMPRQSGDGWFLKYESAKASTRLLLSLPKPMLDDAHAVAKAQGISVAELARRAMTHHMAELVKANPSLVALRGSRQGP